MTTDPLKPPEARHRYVNVLNGLARLVREEGVPGLMRGLIPNTVNIILNNDESNTYLIHQLSSDTSSFNECECFFSYERVLDLDHTCCTRPPNSHRKL